MAKGKKLVQTTHKNNEVTVEHKGNPRKDAKENKPAMERDHVCKTQSSIQGLRGQNKPRSPLSDSSSVLIQEGNDSDPADTSQQKQDIPEKINGDIKEEDKEEEEEKKKKKKAEEAGCGLKEQVAAKDETKDSTKLANTGSAAGSKVSTGKPRSGAAGHRVRAKKPDNKASQNRKVTDYFPIRRSNRKTKAELQNQEHKHLDDLIKNDIEEGMQVKDIEGKGRGVFAARGFRKGDFVVEYHGDLLELAEAKVREAQYAEDPKTGCYMYYFQYHTKTYCVDATRETTRLGRLINHSKNGNCQTKLHPIGATPHLILVASRDIEAEEELLYDYGDRSKASILAHPWLKH